MYWFIYGIKLLFYIKFVIYYYLSKIKPNLDISYIYIYIEILYLYLNISEKEIEWLSYVLLILFTSNTNFEDARAYLSLIILLYTRVLLLITVILYFTYFIHNIYFQLLGVYWLVNTIILHIIFSISVLHYKYKFIAISFEIRLKCRI